MGGAKMPALTPAAMSRRDEPARVGPERRRSRRHAGRLREVHHHHVIETYRALRGRAGRLDAVGDRLQQGVVGARLPGVVSKPSDRDVEDLRAEEGRGFGDNLEAAREGVSG